MNWWFEFPIWIDGLILIAAILMFEALARAYA
jgi:hypothetical protein